MLQENLGWTITSVLMIVLMIASIFAKGLSSILGKYLQDSVLQKRIFRMRKVNLIHHPIFSKYRLLINQRIKYLRCRCPLRKKLFTDLMLIRIEAYDSILKEFIRREELNELSVVEFQYATNELLLRIFAEWETNAKVQEIPPAVTSRFGEATGDIRNLLVFFVSSVSNSSYSYEDNRSRVSAIFDMLCGLEEAIMMKLEESLDEMNGEISETTYKGLKCLNCDVCQSRHSRRIKWKTGV